MAPLLRLTLFGPPGIDGSAAASAAAQGQSLALLAVLACAGERGIPRDKLLALLWPDAAGDRASHRLSQLVHWTRRTLACPGLIAGTTELRLDPDCVACDLWAFREARREGRLERAAELYGGPFLDGFFLPGAGEFERWTESRRSALARDYQETLEALAVQAEVGGDPKAATAWWRRLAEHEPLSSRVTMHLMMALAAGGHRARALERAQAYQHQVRDELDAEPNPAVLALARTLRQEPSDTSGGAPRTARAVAIGVLPLTAPGGDAEAVLLAHGLTEELTSAFAAVPGLRVASRSSVAAVQHTTPDVRELGARLGLAGVVEGSVRLSGRRMRLTVRLLDVADGCQRWTARYDRDMAEGFEAEDALAGDVAEAVGHQLASGAIQGTEPSRESS